MFSKAIDEQSYFMHKCVSGLFFFISFFLVCFVGIFLQSIIPRFRLNPRDKSVLITGCDTGFGLELAKRLDNIGMHVFAGKKC